MSLAKELEQHGLAKKNAMKIAFYKGDSEVQKLYANATVFITGGSGFLGKQLIQKLISSTNLKKIYVLLRSKKGKSIHERLKTILEDPVFELLHKEQSDFVKKIVAVEGDSADTNLGLDEKNWAKISDEVNVIFHVAASINFKEPVKIATLTNIRSVREVLSLAKASKNIKSVVHISTAYVQATKNRDNELIKEEFYECPIPPNALIGLAETIDQEKLEQMIEPIMKKWPNSYTFTKAVAEELIRIEKGNLPVCIVRPAIVIGAYQEPMPGWIDMSNAYGPSGVIIGLSLGAIHALFAKNDAIVDYVPVDIVNNAVIAAAWDTYVRFKNGDGQKLIYTVTGTMKNPITYNYIEELMYTEKIRELMPTKTIWYCCAVCTQYKFLYLILTLLFHYIPGFIIDGCCVIIGKKPRFLKIYKIAYGLSLVYGHFLNNFWRFDGTNTFNLYNKLSETDKIIYNCEMSTVDKKTLYYSWAYGIHQFILKDDLNKNEYALRKQFYFKIAHYILFPLYMFSLYKLSYIIVTFICNILILFYDNFFLNICKC